MKALSKKAFDSVTAMFHDVSGIRLGDHKLALVRAPATLPPAMEVKAMDDCTVDGSRHRYSIPVSRSG